MTFAEQRRPVPAIVKEGGPDELQDLIKRSHVVRLTPSEDARLHALSFAPDADLERARLLVSRHPDLAGQLLGETRRRLEGVTEGQGRQEGYEPRRQAAVDAGVALAEPDARMVADVDAMASEYRATATDPYLTLDATHRAAFAGAIKAGDFGDAIKEWSAWLAEHAERNAFARRRAAALAAFGHSTAADVRPAPSFVPELEAAVGGGTIAETRPIIQR